MTILRNNDGTSWLNASENAISDTAGSLKSKRSILMGNDWTDEERSIAVVVNGALRIIEKLGLELGDNVVIIGNDYFASTLRIVCNLSGCVPVAQFVDNKISTLKEINNTLTQAVRRMTVFVVNGNAADVNEILSNLKLKDRLILLGRFDSKIAINVYKDIHKKGVEVYGINLSSMLDVSEYELDNIRIRKITNIIRMRNPFD